MVDFHFQNRPKKKIPSDALSTQMSEDFTLHFGWKGPTNHLSQFEAYLLWWLCEIYDVYLLHGALYLCHKSAEKKNFDGIVTTTNQQKCSYGGLKYDISLEQHFCCPRLQAQYTEILAKQVTKDKVTLAVGKNQKGFIYPLTWVTRHNELKTTAL